MVRKIKSKRTVQKYKYYNVLAARENFMVLLKVVSATFLLVCFLSVNESTCQTRKNAFYFTSKALFILEKIKF